MKFTAVRIESKCPFSRKRKYLIRIKTLNKVLMIYIYIIKKSNFNYNEMIYKMFFLL